MLFVLDLLTSMFGMFWFMTAAAHSSTKFVTFGISSPLLRTITIKLAPTY